MYILHFPIPHLHPDLSCRKPRIWPACSCANLNSSVAWIRILSLSSLQRPTPTTVTTFHDLCSPEPLVSDRHVLPSFACLNPPHRPYSPAPRNEKRKNQKRARYHEQAILCNISVTIDNDIHADSRLCDCVVVFQTQPRPSRRRHQISVQLSSSTSIQY